MLCPRTVLTALCVLAIPAWCAASDDDVLTGDPLKLETVVAYAQQHNSEIHAGAARWRAAEARPSQAGALPDPMVELAYHNERFDRITFGESDFAFVKLGASQEVPFPGKLGLKHDIAAHEAEQSHAELRRLELDVIRRVKMAYADYAHLDELLDILHRNRALLQNFARIAEAKYAVGQGIQQDVLKAHVELSLLVDRETILAQRRQSQTAELNALLNRPSSAPLGKAEHPMERSLTRSLEDLMSAAQAQAPELQVVRWQVEREDAALALAHREYLPDFVVRADYMNKDGLDPEWEVGLGIKVPLYFAVKQRAGVAEAAAALQRARAERTGTSRSIESRVQDLYARAKASEQLVALYHTTVLPQAHLALDSANAAYQVGKIDFLTLLNSFTVMLEYEMRYHEELSNFQKATAELEAVVGEPVAG